MNLKEFDQFRLSNAINFNDKLNPNLFDKDEKLHGDVRKQLLIIAEDFIDHLGIKDLDIVDIRISGSNAAYTYTPHSDIDLHLLVDIGKLPNDEIYRELFNTKKVIYNDSHNIKIHGYDVELYVEDAAVPVKSLGEYSVLKDKWVKYPSKVRANFDERGTKNKFIKLIQLSELALRSKNLQKVENILNTIKKYRQSGLEKRGEFGPENLAYKALRSRGIVEKLYNHRDKLHSQELSIESKLAQTEDWHPNDTPPGPETKPTMPKGTVRVDVSDVYDWYKLGQHISNMKGLGKHDFGKGPPSTILSFGDEDLEHKYIQDLERTGLTTTDIDPKVHDVKTGQKVDPTFNVDENLSHFVIDFPDVEKGDRVLHPQWGPCIVIGFKNNGTTAILRAKNDPKNRDINIETWRLKNMLQDSISESSGYIPSEKEKNDPRFKTALTVDVKPDSIKKNAKKLGLGTIQRTGVPQVSRSDGKFY